MPKQAKRVLDDVSGQTHPVKRVHSAQAKAAALPGLSDIGKKLMLASW
jgi:hypothetical protein